jgi:hypothetical protein
MDKNLDQALNLAVQSRFSGPGDVYTSENLQRVFSAFESIYELAKDYENAVSPSEAFELYKRDVEGFYRAKRDLKHQPFNTLAGWTLAFPEDIRESYLEHNIYFVNSEIRDSLLQTFSGIHLLSGLDLKQCKATRLMGIGKFRSEEGEYFFATYGITMGKNAEDFLINTFQNNSYSIALEKAHTMVEKFGLFLGELHSNRRGPEMSWPDSFVERNKALLKNAFRFTTLFPETNFLQIDRFFLNCLHEASVVKYRPSFTNGFASLHHYMFEDMENHLFYVAVSGAHFSVDRYGNPIGCPSSDVGSFEQILKELLSDTCCKVEDRADIIETWRDAYLSVAGSFPPEEQLRFFKLTVLLIFLEKIIIASDNRVPERNSRYYLQFQCLVQELQDMLSLMEE